MSSSSCVSTLLRASRCGVLSPFTHHRLQQQQLRFKHRVRVIITRDLPEGHMRGVYAGDVREVAAGYARNYLIPKKMAVYATSRNFERCRMVDPELAPKNDELGQLLKDDVDEDLKAADLLRKYLRNKSVRMIRNVDPNFPTMCHPGHVNARNLRDKLSKQLKIDLEDHETIHIRNETITGLDNLEERDLMRLLKEMDEEEVTTNTDASDVGKIAEGDLDVTEKGVGGDGDVCANHGSETVEQVTNSPADAGKDSNRDCNVKVTKLGEYVAKISLRGGYVIPLKFKVEKR